VEPKVVKSARSTGRFVQFHFGAFRIDGGLATHSSIVPPTMLNRGSSILSSFGTVQFVEHAFLPHC